MNTVAAAELDHLVVVADTLAQGVAWCEAALGVTPQPGGRHALMGTHNRLLAIGGPDYPRAYLEIIAIDPEAAPPQGRARWFGMDEPARQAAARAAPRLLHVAVRVPDLQAGRVALLACGMEAGEPAAVSRATPQGELRWRIALRGDGRLPHGGAQPTLIEWGDQHPTDSLPDSGVALTAFEVGSAAPGPLRAAYAAIGLSRVEVRHDVALETPRLRATFATPRGTVTLVSAD